MFTLYVFRSNLPSKKDRSNVTYPVRVRVNSKILCGSGISVGTDLALIIISLSSFSSSILYHYDRLLKRHDTCRISTSGDQSSRPRLLPFFLTFCERCENFSLPHPLVSERGSPRSCTCRYTLEERCVIYRKKTLASKNYRFSLDSADGTKFTVGR
jgi:hypothetical protein